MGGNQREMERSRADGERTRDEREEKERGRKVRREEGRMEFKGVRLRGESE